MSNDHLPTIYTVDTYDVWKAEKFLLTVAQFFFSISAQF